jgi:hypothetical protein
MVDLACAKTAAFKAEGRPSEVALEHAFNATGQHRRVLMDRYSKDHVLRFAAPELGAKVSALVGSPPRACAAIIAIWAAQRWPESADLGFLHEMLAHPPGGSVFLAGRVIEAMAETGRLTFLPELESLLDGNRGTRLVWRSLAAITRIEGNGDRLIAFLRDSDAPFDPEVSAGLPRAFAALPRDERGPVAAALLEEPGSMERLRAGLHLARQAEVAALVAPDVERLARASAALTATDARAAISVLHAGLPRHGINTRVEIAADPTAPAALRLASLRGLDPQTIDDTLSTIPMDERVDGSLLLEAIHDLSRRAPDLAAAQLDRWAKHREGRRVLARATGCPDAGDVRLEDCLQSLLEPT